MTIYANVHVERGGNIEVSLDGGGDVCIAVYPSKSWLGSVNVYVYKDRTPELHARLCKAFGLQNETAPGDQTESGVPGGNEPAQEMVPQKVQG